MASPQGHAGFFFGRSSSFAAVACTLRTFPFEGMVGKRRPASTLKLDQHVSDLDVFEHVMRGVPLGALLGVLTTFAKNSAALTSHGAALFKIAVEAVAVTT